METPERAAPLPLWIHSILTVRKEPLVSVTRIAVSPAHALRMLTQVHQVYTRGPSGGRGADAASVANLADAMRSGEWEHTALTAVRVSRAGSVVDGQQILLAIVYLDKSVTIYLDVIETLPVLVSPQVGPMRTPGGLELITKLAIDAWLSDEGFGR